MYSVMYSVRVHRAAARSMTGLAAGGLGRRPADRINTGLTGRPATRMDTGLAGDGLGKLQLT